MNNFFKCTALILFTILIFSCGTASQFQVILNAKKDFNPKILILPLSNTLIPQKEQEKLMLGKEQEKKFALIKEKKMFNSFIAPTIADNSISKVLDEKIDYDKLGVNFVYKKMYSDNKNSSINMFVPEKGEFKFGKIIPKYVLLFEDLNIEKEFKADGGGLGSSPQTIIEVNSSLQYCIWDNQNHNIIGYGEVGSTTVSLILPKRSGYIKIFDELSKKIIEKSPLKLK